VTDEEEEVAARVNLLVAHYRTGEAVDDATPTEIRQLNLELTSHLHYLPIFLAAEPRGGCHLFVKVHLIHRLLTQRGCLLGEDDLVTTLDALMDFAIEYLPQIVTDSLHIASKLSQAIGVAHRLLFEEAPSLRPPVRALRCRSGTACDTGSLPPFGPRNHGGHDRAI
jgi:hypothetical protein